MSDFINKISTELGINYIQVRETLNLLGSGATIPFIARYRKEVTGNLDEVQIANIRDRNLQLEELEKRRSAIIKSVREQDKLTPELEEVFLKADSITVLEDLYLPYKPKRKTKAGIAREKGLEPLAENIFLQSDKFDPYISAESFLNAEKGVNTPEEALQGARDIIAEKINEDAGIRAKLRKLFQEHGTIRSEVLIGKENEGAKYQDYFQWEEPLKSIPAHRLLAMFRGENEMFLLIRIGPEETDALEMCERYFIRTRNASADQVKIAVKDSYKRLLSPSLQTEFRNLAKEKADKEAIAVFSENVRQLLMAAPLGQKNVLAIDPGFRTGCKVVCLNKQGDLLHNETIYPHSGRKEAAEAKAKIENKVNTYKIEAIAIGNGTASRETEAFIREIRFENKPLIVMVSENGASVYSASSVAREEFPEYDVTVRGAVSIGRRLMDPLAELVKIEPKSVGVGQYQHDVDQNALQNALNDVVSSCVNKVGVEVNTASKQLLTYVSGLGEQLAQNIIDYRKKNGPFMSRRQLMDVPRMGEKAFEQCAGFLRIRNAVNPLDSSAVHPESYHIVEKIARSLNCSVQELVSNETLKSSAMKIKPEMAEVGEYTWKDILNELSRPGRDPRDKFEVFSFSQDVTEMKDLKTGMILPGIVTNITAFGAFVDIGVHQDGLVHISQMADRFIKDPNEVVKLHQKVKVRVLEVDISRKRIQLSMKS